MLRAIRADASVGSASASSNALVCSDCVPPRVAASASTAVRTTLLYGSWLVRLTPEVWQWVRSISERGSLGLNSAPTHSAHSSRAARSFATSMKKFIPMPKKNDSRGAKASTSSPPRTAARTYSMPSASVNASSCTAVAPASCMW